MPSNWLDDLYGVEQPKQQENWLDTLYPVEKPTTAAPAPVAPKKPLKLDTSTIQGKFMQSYLDKGKEEYDRMQMNPIISDRAKDEIAETLKGYGQLATHPLEIVKGAADFFMSLPAFGIGIFAAGKNMLERMGRPFNLSDLYKAASEGMAEAQKTFGREAMNPVIGPPSQESELVGATAMAPALALSALGNNIAERFEGYPNVQGAMRFAGDIGGLVALGKIYKGSKADVARKAEEVTTKAADIAQKETLVEQGMDEALKSAQKKILETEKIKLENEAKALQEELNYEQMIKEDLYRKGEEIHRAKQVEAKSDVASIEKAVKEVEGKEAASQVVDTKALEDMILEDAAGMKDALESTVKEHGREVTQEMLNPGKIYARAYKRLRDEGVSKEDAKTRLQEPFSRYEERFKEVTRETEPVTEVDELTGREIPELTGDQHPMRETDAAKTEAMAERFEQTKYTEDVELYTQKLINDMNRWLDGNDEVKVGDVRDTLSTLATRADELRYSFDDPKYFVDWKDVVEEAANWARQAERSKEPLRKIDLQSEEAVKADLERIDALEKEYGKPIDEITDAEIEKFFTEREVSLADADFFGEGELDFFIPLRKMPKAVLQFAKETKTKFKKVFRNDALFKKTGYWMGKDGKWRYELDESKAKFYAFKFAKFDWDEAPLPEIFKLDELYKEFPKLKKYTVEIDKQARSEGTFYPGKNVIELKDPYDRSSLLHEIQHAINYEMGISDGTSITSEYRNIAVRALNEIIKDITDEETLHLARSVRDDIWTKGLETGTMQAMIETVVDKSRNKAMDVNSYENHYKVLNATSYLMDHSIDNYLTNKGEMEARLVQKRMDMPPALRKKVPPWDSLDRMLIEEGWDRAEPGMELYSGIPVHKIKDIFKQTKPNKPLETKTQLSEAAKAILEGAKRARAYSEKAQGVRRTDYKRAAKELRKNFNRDFIDRSGNIRQDLLNVLGDEGYDILQKMYLSKGASALSARMLKRMQHEVYGGLSRANKKVLDRLIFHTRMADLGKYKTEKEFAYFKDHPVSESIAYIELMKQIEKLPDGVASKLHRRAEAYFEWMKKPLKDLLDSGIISEEEFTNLSSHNYRRLQLVDIFDNRYQTKIGKKKMTVWDSGVQALAKGKGTDIFEQSSEIMALEVFNRAYGRILRNEANKGLIELARKSPDNPFVRIKTKDQRIPSGWQRIFAFEKGERKSIYLSPDMSKEWITNSPEISYRLSQMIRTLSGSSILRTFATGINWGFALANLPKDVMHSWFAARTFENGKWKSVYNPNMPIFLGQMGRDLTTVFYDAATRGKRYDAYIREGGGMEFLVHQGRLLGRGRRLETPLDKIQNFFGYFGETSEIMTRLAIRERLIRKGKSPQEATFAARDYMDFGQGGGVTKALDNAIPYLNASVVATRGMFRALKENKYASSWKLAQFAALTTGLYLAGKQIAPKTSEEVKYSVDSQNNLIIPLSDKFRFIDEYNQERGIYLKIPIDPGQKFFKKFFEAATDRWLGKPLDINGTVDALKQLTPVPGITEVLPPSISGPLGYVTNKDFWLNEDIWRETKPFKFPDSGAEFIPGETPQFFIDLGEVTGLSPERTQYAIEELFTSGTIWSYLVGKGYDELFADLPKDMSEQHLAMTLARFPGIRRFIGVTNPYTKHAQMVSDAEQKADLDYWIQTRELDRLANGFLFEKSVPEKDVYKYIRSTGDKDTIERLFDRYQFHKATRDLPERSFWLRLQGLKLPARAEAYVKRFYGASEEEKNQMRKEISIIGAAGGVFSKNFWAEVQKYRAENRE